MLSVFQVWYLHLNAGSEVAGSGKKTTSSKCKITVLNLPAKHQGETFLFREPMLSGKCSLRGDGPAVEALGWIWLNASLVWGLSVPVGEDKKK